MRQRTHPFDVTVRQFDPSIDGNAELGYAAFAVNPVGHLQATIPFLVDAVGPTSGRRPFDANILHPLSLHSSSSIKEHGLISMFEVSHGVRRRPCGYLLH